MSDLFKNHIVGFPHKAAHIIAETFEYNPWDYKYKGRTARLLLNMKPQFLCIRIENA